MSGKTAAAISSAVFALACGGPALGQAPPWAEFQDQITGRSCGIINAANLEIVALRSSGQMMAVGQNGDDIQDFFLPGVFVDLNSTDQAGGFPVFADGEFAGIVSFEDDAQRASRVWWGFADTIEDPLFLASYDVNTDVINRTNDTPADFVGAPCDACELWDNPADCPEPPPVVDPPRVTINFCGAGGTATMAMTFAGLMATSIARRRRI
jgi:hypothetical protein